MKRYPKYKDTGVEWIGEIPSNWILRKIKHNTYVKGRIGWQGLKTDEYLQEGFAYLVTGTDFSNGGINWKSCFYVDQIRYSEDHHIQLKEGDLLITKDGTIGKIALVKGMDKPSTLNSGIFLVRPLNSNYSTTFLYWVLFSPVFAGFFDYHKSGSTISHLYQNIFVDFVFPVPEMKIQSQICTFLDHKSQQIDDLTARKQNIIELLKEERTAIINQAVTKGLDPNVPMKDSGIECLGKLPIHWELKRLKHLVNPKLQYGANETGIDYNPTYPRYIRITDFDQDGNLRNDTLLSLDPQVAQNYLLNEGDVLFARSGATVGKTFIYRESDGNVCFAGYLIKATTIKSVLLSDFLYYLTQSNYYDNWKESIFSQATIQNIGANKYEDFLVPLPSIKEQKEIVLFIEDKSENIKSSILKIEKEIELISEYKTSLINEAVTGKIDVRDYQITHA